MWGRPPPSPASSPDSRRHRSPLPATYKSNNINGHLDPAAQRALVAQGSFRAAASPAMPALAIGEVKCLERSVHGPKLLKCSVRR